MMLIQNPAVATLQKEPNLIASHLPLEKATVLELGCGTAQMTRMLAERFPSARIIATEVDTIQHGKNIASEHPTSIQFREGGAQAIAEADNSVDVVFMFKSLHHVPRELLRQALLEVVRVLKPGGYAWISEPVFAGEYNEILRLFHNEQEVRELAFQAVSEAVEQGTLELAGQLFFNSESWFSGFDEFEKRVLQVTHTHHKLSDEVYAEVKRRFMQHMGPDGARFESPMRVDLLRKSI